ncbi:Ni/Fe hydrogenase subunit alpha [Halobacteriovorax sp. GFR7]|uniref:Ni/Fe hydrogenase subunit alpha n=1 Tax=unclassified Halobacteriovorax TaxID=2639665 RepID=UPI003D973F13
MSKKKTIKVEYLARVEGEGAFHLEIENEKVIKAHLKIFEPPRFFEAFLRGRDFREAPDITARICGICPVAYMMSSVHAMEDVAGVTIPDDIKELRRLLYCGEWIESHMLHMIMLHAPDFLGFESAIAMASKYKKRLQQGLFIKKVGNEILSLMGAREIHPINIKLGGFYKIPSTTKIQQLKENCLKAQEELIDLVKWMKGFNFPELTREYLFVSTFNQNEYPMNCGVIATSHCEHISIDKYEEYFFENHVKYTNALQSSFKGKDAYLVGPMARFHLNYDQLSVGAKQLAKDCKLEKKCLNPFKSLLVRAVEVFYAFDEAIRIINKVKTPPKNPSVEVRPKAGVGHGCTEAPRGMLWHKYEIDNNGIILNAKIVPPTSQNQLMIEEDLKEYAQNNLHLSDEELKWHLEQSIRNYDPCISCATHFLKLEVNRR